MKNYISIFALVFICTVLFVSCTRSEKTNNSSINYSGYSFVNTSWERNTENDTETIRFGEDGSFSYSCACGNPINASDLCESYTYDDTTQTITLNYIEPTDEMITIVKIIKCNEKELHLDFNDDIRIFTK